MIQHQDAVGSFRPKPVIGTRTVSVGDIAPDAIRVGRPAKAAAEVGSQNWPSERG